MAVALKAKPGYCNAPGCERKASQIRSSTLCGDHVDAAQVESGVERLAAWRERVAEALAARREDYSLTTPYKAYAGSQVGSCDACASSLFQPAALAAVASVERRNTPEGTQSFLRLDLALTCADCAEDLRADRLMENLLESRGFALAPPKEGNWPYSVNVLYS